MIFKRINKKSDRLDYAISCERVVTVEPHIEPRFGLRYDAGLHIFVTIDHTKDYPKSNEALHSTMK